MSIVNVFMLIIKKQKKLPIQQIRQSLKQLEAFGRRLQLKWHFRNEGNKFVLDPFKQKSSCNLCNKYGAIEIYMNGLEEK